MHAASACEPCPSQLYTTVPRPLITNPRTLQRLVERIDGFSEWTGRSIAWLTLAMVLIQFLVVVLRYGFSEGSIATQESITYLHALVFMLGAAYTLKREGHVRVDIFYRKMSDRGRAWVDLLGTLLLLAPMFVFLVIVSWTTVINSWTRLEGSPEAGGLPLVFLLKTILLVMPVLMLLQGISLAARNLLRLSGFQTASTTDEVEV